MHREDIIRYYNETRLDYRWFWFRKNSNRPMHFGYFDPQIKGHWDSLEQLNKVMAAKVGIGPGDVILDAGCGQGGSALWLASDFEDVQVEGITLVPHQVNIARKAAKKRGLTNARFTIGDYCSMDYPDGYFSVIWACESLCHASVKLDFYKEAFRVLRPGGRLIIADGIRAERALSVEEATLFHEWLAGWCCPGLDSWEEHHKNIIDVGFSRLHMEDITPFVTPSMQRLATISRRILPLGKFLKMLKLRSAIRHRNLLSAIQQYEALQKGLWTYGLLFAIKPQ